MPTYAEIRQNLIDPQILRLKEDLLGSGISFGRIQPSKLPPSTVVVGGSGGTTDPNDLGFIQGIAIYSGGTLIGSDKYELAFYGPGVTVTAHRGIIDIATPLATKLTNPMTTAGDIIYGTTGGVPLRRGIGTNGQYLSVVGGVPTWVTVASGTGTLLVDPTTTLGDMIYRDSSAITRLPIGTNTDILVVSGGIPAWKTDDFVHNPMIAPGDIIYGLPGTIYTDIAPNGVASQSSFNGSPNAAFAIDSNDATTASMQGSNSIQWLQVTFSAPVRIVKFRLLQDTGFTGADSYKIQSSDDGSSWTDRYNIASGAPSDSGQITLSTPIVAKYWRAWTPSSGAFAWNIYTLALYKDNAGTATRLAIGTPGQVLTVTSGYLPEWLLASGAALVDPTTTTGDLIYRNASTITRLPIGTSGQVLTVVSGNPTWATPSGVTNVFTTLGDMLYAASGVVSTRLPIGASGQVLTVINNIPTWSNPTSGGSTTASGFSQVIGDDVTTTFPITHNLGTRDVLVQVRENTAPYEYVFPSIYASGVNVTVVEFNSAPISSGYVTLIGFGTGSAGSGAPTNAKYITSASDATLSAEVVIPGLAASPDIKNAAGAGTSEEFDSGASPFTWGSALAVENVNSTIVSHIYLKSTVTGENIGSKSWGPSGAFDARVKLLFGSDMTTQYYSIGMHVGASGNTSRLLALATIDVGTNRQMQVSAHTYAGSYTQRGSTWLWGALNGPLYLRLARDGSNNCSFYFSTNGILWQLIATQSLTFTVDNIGFRLDQGDTAPAYYAVDWLRTDV